MAADSDGYDLTTVVTCEGDLHDPDFRKRFDSVVHRLNGILGEAVKVRKLEPWNSVRVTLSIPREAALRLRKLASEGSAQLRALGILSVQVEGDQVISLRIASSVSSEPQEIRLQTTQDGSGSSQVEGPLSRFLSAATSVDSSEKVQFKSPNVVCPADGVVPTPPPATKAGGPFPFASMNQALHGSNYTTPPPPPYPGKATTTTTAPPPPPPPSAPAVVAPAPPPTVTLSSPLLVNLLQNDAKDAVASAVKNRTIVQKSPRTIVKNTRSQASTSPSALSNTSIRPNSTMPPQYPLPPPPPYSVAVTRQWDSVVQTSPLLDLTPSLKADDLEHLLPTLERDLARSPPPEIPEELTKHLDDKRNFLINPLTGELEPQSSGESEPEELGDVFTGLPSPAALSDDDTNSTTRPDTTDQSDSETPSSDSGKHSRKTKKDRGRDSPKPATEKIKLRLKLEKSEPISAGYKVDVSFIQQQPKKATTSAGAGGEELRVPPLHISLRGRHHAFITNKKKKLMDKQPKVRKTQDKKTESISAIEEERKKFKSNHEHDSADLISKLVIHSSTHYKEKQKERRGSDSELSRANQKFVDSNGIISVEKKRRLSQSDGGVEIDPPAVLGSTNVGTIAGLPQKPTRKEKSKVKDVFKSKDAVRSKSFCKTLVGEKFTKQVVALPTGEIDMEAKFKQRLMEGTDKGIPRPPHRTDGESSPVEKVEQLIKVDTDAAPLAQKSPEPDKCNTPDRKQPPDHLMTDKQSGRSPNSGAQGEDSGIESMDALSEKSPNQASQSPHADIIPEPPTSHATGAATPETPGEVAAVVVAAAAAAATDDVPIKSKTQVPEMADMLDIEAQLAKMEGLNGVEDINENCGDGVKECCEVKEQQQQEDALVPAKAKTKEDSLEPLPIRVTPPLYTYSNPDKLHPSPNLTDEEDSNPLPASAPQLSSKTKSLLEQLLIEIPSSTDGGAPSSPSPATRSSVRTRALSKLSSPVATPPPTTTSNVAAVVKRKRNESDSSANGGGEDVRKKTRKCSENAAELIKACMGVEGGAVKSVKKKVQDESSDSDEPLIEKVRKTGGKKVKNKAMSTRRSVRTQPAVSTRSKVETTTEAIRRKTRSAVSDGDSKRKKEVK